MKNKLFLSLFLITLATISSYAAFAGNEDKIEIVITTSTTQQDLEKITAQLKNEGYDFKVTNTNYENGRLESIRFKVSGNDMNGNYSQSGMEKDQKIYLVIDKKNGTLHIGDSPNLNSYEKCSAKCAKNKVI